MNPLLLLRGSYHRPADEAPATTPTYTSEPLPILPDGSFDLTGTIHEPAPVLPLGYINPEPCAICSAFGQLCCKLHQAALVAARSSRRYPDEAPARDRREP